MTREEIDTYAPVFFEWIEGWSRDKRLRNDPVDWRNDFFEVWFGGYQAGELASTMNGLAAEQEPEFITTTPGELWG